MISIEELLKEVEVDPPCGPNLEYDPRFVDAERAARGTPDREMGDQRISGTPPNWPEVRERVEQLFGYTKDIRLAALLTQALTATQGLVGLKAGIDLIHGLLNRYWEHVHPQISPEDHDPTERVNAVAALADRLFLSAVRAAVVAEDGPTRHVTVQDVLFATNHAQASHGERPMALSTVKAMLRGVATFDPARLEAARDTAVSATLLETLIRDRLGAEHTTDLKPLRQLLEPVSNLCAELFELDEDREIADPTPTQPLHLMEQPKPQEIRSDEEASRMLDQVCAYVERTSPGNPASVLIRRASRLLTRSFIEILEDLASSDRTANSPPTINRSRRQS